MSESKILGVVGGMGPLAGAAFFKKLCDLVRANSDGDYPDVIMTSFASTPDRTDYILGRKTESPVTKIKKSIDILVYGGAGIISMPCNTADCFFDELSAYSPVPFLSIIKETVNKAYLSGARKLGIMATDGTVKCRAYQKVCSEYGITAHFPPVDLQAIMVNEIYLSLKAGKKAGCALKDVAYDLIMTCDMIAFACTELSLADISDWVIRDRIIDSLTTLAERSLIGCGRLNENELRR